MRVRIMPNHTLNLTFCGEWGPLQTDGVFRLVSVETAPKKRVARLKNRQAQQDLGFNKWSLAPSSGACRPEESVF